MLALGRAMPVYQFQSRLKYLNNYWIDRHNVCTDVHVPSSSGTTSRSEFDSYFAKYLQNFPIPISITCNLCSSINIEGRELFF